MLTFFRRIRKKLITLGAARTYVFYGIGEIALVVIGILIALQINNWNEYRKDRDSEKAYLMRLHSDLTFDTTNFNQELAINQIRNEQISKFTELINSTHPNIEELLEATQTYLESGWFFPHFKPTTSTFDELTSTGKMTVITNEDLRIRVIELYTDYIDWRKVFNTNESWVLPLDSDLVKSTDALKWDSRTQSLFQKKNLEEEGRILMENRDAFVRNAAIHFNINDIFFHI